MTVHPNSASRFAAVARGDRALHPNTTHQLSCALVCHNRDLPIRSKGRLSVL